MLFFIRDVYASKTSSCQNRCNKVATDSFCPLFLFLPNQNLDDIYYFFTSLWASFMGNNNDFSSFVKLGNIFYILSHKTMSVVKGKENDMFYVNLLFEQVSHQVRLYK